MLELKGKPQPVAPSPSDVEELEKFTALVHESPGKLAAAASRGSSELVTIFQQVSREYHKREAVLIKPKW